MMKSRYLVVRGATILKQAKSLGVAIAYQETLDCHEVRIVKAKTLFVKKAKGSPGQ